MTIPIECYDDEPPYAGWAQIVNATKDNPDYDPAAEPQPSPENPAPVLCQQPFNPCCIPKYVEGTDYTIERRPSTAPGHLIHIAIHGGNIDLPTTQLARYAATRDDDHAFYSLVGLMSIGDRNELRLSSTAFDEPQGVAMVGEADRTVSWHMAFDQAPYVDRPVTYISGADGALGTLIRQKLTEAGFTVAASGDPEGNGSDPSNIANRNRLSAGVLITFNWTQALQFFSCLEDPQAAYPEADPDMAWLACISADLNRTPEFFRYVDAVQAAIADLTKPPPVPGHDSVGGNYLGCADNYSAAIHWRGGGQTYIPTNFISQHITECEWERRLSSTSAARIVLGKTSMDAACCYQMGQIHPWCHELTIYRDDQLVWQGPILSVAETLGQITIEARDVTAWLDRLVNTVVLDWAVEVPDPVIPGATVRQPTPVDLATVANKVIRDNLTSTEPIEPTPYPDWPFLLDDHADVGFTDYLVVEQTGINTKVMRRVPWVETVLGIIDTLVPKGLEYTTVGRRMVVRGPKKEEDISRATFTPDDLPGGMTVTRDGADAVTRVWATTQQENRDGHTVTVAVEDNLAVCGRLDMLVRNSDRVDLETQEETNERHSKLIDARDADITAIRDQYAQLIANDQQRRENEINACGSSSACAEQRRRESNERIEALRRQRDSLIDARNTKYDEDTAASDQSVRDRELQVLTEILLTEAQNEILGRWNIPIGIAVADGARVSPTAPVRVHELVPGEKFDVFTRGFCQTVLRSMRLEVVRGKWSDLGEEIGVSLIPLRVPVLES